MKYSVPVAFAELSNAVKAWLTLVNEIAVEADNQDGATALTARYAGELAAKLANVRAETAADLRQIKATRKK